MAGQATPRGVLLDCLGTLVRLLPPAPRLREALRARAGVEVAPAAAEAAMRAEIAFYRAHMDRAVDLAALEALRDDCALVVKEALAEPLGPVPVAVVRAALLDALRFEPFGDAVPALGALRAAGLRLVVVSNWDVSLHEVLARTGLDVLLDGAVASAEVGAAKPDPAPVRRGLELAGVAPADAWLVGDTPEADVEGARAVGVRPVLLDRTGAGTVPGVAAIRSLEELATLVS
jgi:putative hydrolase of the HAD superfamily